MMKLSDATYKILAAEKLQMRAASMIVVLLLTAIMMGCDNNVKKSTRTNKEKTLVHALETDVHPNNGAVYTLSDSDIDLYVKSTNAERDYYIDESYLSIVPAVVVNSRYDYCDGEALRPGLYKYIGNRIYEIETPVEVGDDTRLILKKVKCRAFVETRLTAPVDGMRNNDRDSGVKKRKHVKDSYL